MHDLVLMIAMFLLGTAFGLSLAEVISYSCRVRYYARKKKQEMQPLLGVVLPPEEKK